MDLSGVSCNAPSACTAVGAFLDGRDRERALIERWNGRRWRSQQAARRSNWKDVGLAGVTCIARTDCVAVGAATGDHGCGVPVVEVWHGRQWSLQATPRAAPCVVRQFGEALAVSSSLTRVSCASPTSCAAVGEINIAAASADSSGVEDPLVERWTGRGWWIQPSRFSFGPLTGISCPTQTVCVAAGDGELGIWSAGVWSVTDRVAAFDDVSCSGVTACTAVGVDIGPGNHSRLLADHWDGRVWAGQRPTPPQIGIDPRFTGISCPAPGECTAVGEVSASEFSHDAFAERWTGSSWRPELVARPAHARSMALLGVSCTTTSCLAVGTLGTGSHRLPLVERGPSVSPL